jgi:DNA-binding NarL/FixJ family response regulator
LRVLIADDHEVVRKGVRLLAAEYQWDLCGEASNGVDAIVKVLQLAPDVIILDLSMPKMNGYDAATEIRRVAPSTKIILFSIHDVPTTARSVGADAFVTKSGAPQDLAVAIQRLFAQQSGVETTLPVTSETSASLTLPKNTETDPLN